MFSFAKRFVDKLDVSTGLQDASNDSYFKSALEINNKGYGLRVLNVKPHSLAHQYGFESWFDYIIRINNHELPMLHVALSSFAYNINEDGSINYGGQTTQEQAGKINFELLKQEISTIAKNDKQIVFDVWSAKGGIIRQIIVPLTEYVTMDVDDSLNNLFVGNFYELGMTLQSQHLNTATYVWRILVTHKGSPSFQSQLIPYSDYIIGCDSAFPDDRDGQGMLTKGGEALLSRTILGYYNHYYALTQEDNIPITLYVYNHDYDILRPVTVNLSRSWGTGQNKGILGCDVGYGLLHRIPEVVGKFGGNAVVDDLLFVSQPVSEAPKEISPPSPPPPPPNSFNPMGAKSSLPPPRAAPKKKKTVRAPVNDLSDYMNEELEKSKQLDSHPSNSTHTSTSQPPPPPSSKS